MFKPCSDGINHYISDQFDLDQLDENNKMTIMGLHQEHHDNGSASSREINAVFS